MLAAAAFTACNKDNEYHQTYVLRPAEGAILVSGEASIDSLVFTTTESFTLSTTVSPGNISNDWYAYPDDFNSFTNTYENAIIEFHVPIQFKRNETKQQRSVIFNINAGDYSVQAIFIQDTLQTIKPAIDDEAIDAPAAE